MYFWLALAVVLLIMVPVAPKLMRLRIRLLRWLHWDWAADVLEKNFDFWVAFTRIALILIAAAIFLIGMNQ